MRKRDPSRLDTLVSAATTAFITRGFARAKIHQIADLASMGPGTVYLYVKDKAALFELTVLRALESPAVANPALPYRAHASGPSRKLALRKAIEATVHFPQLWVSLGRREVSGVGEEFRGILLETALWIVRYSNAIRLAEANRIEWPDIAGFFDDLVWRDLHRHLATYLTTRMHTGHIRSAGPPTAVADVVLEAFVGSLAVRTTAANSRPSGDDTPPVPLATELLAASLLGSGEGPPLLPEAGH